MTVEELEQAYNYIFWDTMRMDPDDKKKLERLYFCRKIEEQILDSIRPGVLAFVKNHVNLDRVECINNYTSTVGDYFSIQIKYHGRSDQTMRYDCPVSNSYVFTVMEREFGDRIPFRGYTND